MCGVGGGGHWRPLSVDHGLDVKELHCPVSQKASVALALGPTRVSR